MKFNPTTQKLNFDGFDFTENEFGGKSYIRRVDELDARKGKNGFALIGEFMNYGEDTYEEGKLYLSCSRGGEKDIYHLFTVQDGEFVLLKTSKSQKGAVKVLWDTMEEFLSHRPKKTPQQLLNTVLKEEQNIEALRDFAVFLLKYTAEA